MATVRKRTREMANGRVQTTWVADYFDQHRKRHLKTFPTKKAARPGWSRPRARSPAACTPPSAPRSMSDEAASCGWSAARSRTSSAARCAATTRWCGCTSPRPSARSSWRSSRPRCWRAGATGWSPACSRSAARGPQGARRPKVDPGGSAAPRAGRRRTPPCRSRSTPGKRDTKKLEVGVDIPGKEDVQRLLATAASPWAATARCSSPQSSPACAPRSCAACRGRRSTSTSARSRCASAPTSGARSACRNRPPGSARSRCRRPSSTRCANGSSPARRASSILSSRTPSAGSSRSPISRTGSGTRCRRRPGWSTRPASRCSTSTPCATSPRAVDRARVHPEAVAGDAGAFLGADDL